MQNHLNICFRDEGGSKTLTIAFHGLPHRIRPKSVVAKPANRSTKNRRSSAFL
jgi:hypothetical protein